MHYANAPAAGRAAPSGGAVKAARRWRERLARTEPTVRSRLFALVLCVVLPALLVSVLAAVRAWDAGRATTERALAARAEALAFAVKRELDLSRVMLQVLATSPRATSPPSTPGSARPPCRRARASCSPTGRGRCC